MTAPKPAWRSDSAETYPLALRPLSGDYSGHHNEYGFTEVMTWRRSSCTSLRHYDALAAGGARFYLSGMSAKSRGLSDADLEGKSAEFAMPTVLVKLAVDHDTLFAYRGHVAVHVPRAPAV